MSLMRSQGGARWLILLMIGIAVAGCVLGPKIGKMISDRVSSMADQIAESGRSHQR